MTPIFPTELSRKLAGAVAEIGSEYPHRMLLPAILGVAAAVIVNDAGKRERLDDGKALALKLLATLIDLSAMKLKQ